LELFCQAGAAALLAVPWINIPLLIRGPDCFDERWFLIFSIVMMVGVNCMIAHKFGPWGMAAFSGLGNGYQRARWVLRPYVRYPSFPRVPHTISRSRNVITPILWKAAEALVVRQVIDQAYGRRRNGTFVKRLWVRVRRQADKIGWGRSLWKVKLAV
jgi:hypothetical protein